MLMQKMQIFRFFFFSLSCLWFVLFLLGTGPDGVTRGAYSYLDDKGVQRTTQYIAGAGIGYRVVQGKRICLVTVSGRIEN